METGSMPKSTVTKRNAKPEFITPSGLIGKRGWTRAAVNLFLPGGPDKLVPNPHYRTGPPMQLYAVKRVLRMEKSAKFKKWLESGAEKRKATQAAAAKGVATKRQRLHE